MSTLNVVFSLDTGELTEEQARAIDGIPHHNIGVSGTRKLVTALIKSERISEFQELLSLRSPVIIGAWKQDGSQYGGPYPFNKDAYLDLTPTHLADGANPVQIHCFSGWKPKIFD